jgi:hypothetical protein
VARKANAAAVDVCCACCDAASGRDPASASEPETRDLASLAWAAAACTAAIV